MNGLSRSFDYDIFLSYGWSGNLLPDEGDRGWVGALYERLNDRMRTLLGESARIFIDRDASQAGYLSDRLAAAVDSSSLMLFVVSPGSCRPGSWCHREAARFWDRGARPLISDAGLVLAPEDRIFKAVLSPVEPALQPSVLKEVTERIFCDSVLGTGGSIARPADWSRPSAVVESEFLNLTQDIASRLSLLKKIERNATAATGKRVFLGACSTELNRGRFRRLRRELLLEGHTVTSATPIPEETEADFLLRTGDAMHKANVAVFAIGDASQTPSGWRANAIAIQLESAFGLSEAEPGFSVFAWEDPAAASIDSAALDRVKPNRRDQHIRGGKAFEYLQSNVVARLRIPPEPAVSEKTENSKTICIEYREEDGDRAAQVRDALRERNIQVQLAIPTPAKGTLINRIIKKNQLRYYSGAHGLVVFFGEGDYEWVSDVCFAMKDYMRPGTGVIMLGPPRDKPPGKDRYDQPGFQSMKCFEAPFGQEFEAWIEQLRSGAI